MVVDMPSIRQMLSSRLLAGGVRGILGQGR
jgi:hypothetical protein